MAINFGISGATALYFGTQSASKAYFGTTLVFGGNRDYSLEYMTFEIISAGTLSFIANTSSFTPTISYSTDNGSSWASWAPTAGTGTEISVQSGDKVLVKGSNARYATSSQVYSKFGGTSYFNVYGNAMSLIYGDNFIGQTAFTTEYAFERLFDSSRVVSAEHLVLPSLSLYNYEYERMFYNCNSLTTAPSILPATTLATNCYYYMFYGCTSLVNAPELPATTLKTQCYCRMFWSCTSLATAPALPATTLAMACYSNMFYGCTSLVNAPTLPATSLVINCYQSMLRGCTSLNYVKCLATSGISTTNCADWLNGVSASGTFVKDANATWGTGVSAVPEGWTIVDNA